MDLPISNLSLLSTDEVELQFKRGNTLMPAPASYHTTFSRSPVQSHFVVDKVLPQKSEIIVGYGQYRNVDNVGRTW